MAEKTKTATPEFTLPEFEGMTEQFKEATDKATDISKKVATAYLEGYEKSMTGFLNFERKIAAQSQVDAISTLLNAHADMTSDLTKITVSTTREFITA